MGLPIITLDECSICLTARMKKVWAVKGTKPIGFVRYSIKRTHIVGAFSNNALIVDYVKRIDSEKIMEFLDNLKFYHKKFVLVMDNAGWHRSKEVKVYLEINKNDILVEYLPPYSPELNPTETCWRLIRRNVLDSTLFNDLAELKLGINDFIKSYGWNINVFNYLCR